MHDPDGTPVVLDWRAPVSRPFYRASQSDPMGLTLRRRFGFAGGALTAYEDERFEQRSGEARPRSDESDAQPTSNLLITEIERPRSGPMRDIVATIQPEQDDIVRADAATTVCVQGAPGTGKTAVGLHRVAYLLYAHKEQVTRRGVVVVGPNLAFLSYIRNVLPALGELDVTQTTVADLVASTPVKATDTDEAATVKGDARMAEVLRDALWAHDQGARARRSCSAGARAGCGCPRTRSRRSREELRDRGVRYGTGRELLAHRIAHVLLTQLEAAGETCDDRTHDAVRRSAPVRKCVDEVWPKVDPKKLVFTVLSDQDQVIRNGRGLLSDAGNDRDPLAEAAARPRLGPLDPRRPGADRRGGRPHRAHAVDRAHRGGRGAGPVADGGAGDRPAVRDRGGDRARRHRAGHHPVGRDLLARRCSLTWASRTRRSASSTSATGCRGRYSTSPPGCCPRSPPGCRRPGRCAPTRTRSRVRPRAAGRARRAGGGGLRDRARPPRFGRGDLRRRAGGGGRGRPARRPGSRFGVLGARRASDGGMPGDGRLTIVPVTLAKGLEFDHVVLVEPGRIATGEAYGLQAALRGAHPRGFPAYGISR